MRSQVAAIFGTTVLTILPATQFYGVMAMGAAVMIFFALPWLDRSPVKSIRYRPGWHKYLYGVFVIFFAGLPWKWLITLVGAGLAFLPLAWTLMQQWM